MAAAPAWNLAKHASPRVLRIAHHGVFSPWRQRERELISLGADITLVSSRTWNEGGRDVDFYPESDNFALGVQTMGRHPSVFVFAPLPLWRVLSEDWDLIDLHEEPNSLVTAEVLLMCRLRQLDRPFLLYSAQNIKKHYPPPFRWIERYSLRRAAGAYVCNAEAGRILRAKGLRGPARLIGLGVDLGLFAPAQRERPGQPLKVGYVGRLEPHKGVSTLLSAAAAATDWSLEIVGDGPERADLGRQAERLGIAHRVHFAGHIGSELPNFYRQLDVIVIPSLPTKTWLEQFCRVAIEAMASGVPVVASRSGAIPDVVGEAGLLIEPGEPAALRDAVTEATEPSQWQKLRLAGLQRAQHYGWPQIASQHMRLYQDVLQRRPTAHASDIVEPPEVVVVAYGSPEPLVNTLHALDGCLSVTIVDNSSLPDTAALAQRFDAHYVDAHANIGFAAGVNLALKSLAERGRDRSDVLLLNPDAVISADGILGLQKALHTSPTHACVAPAQTNPGTGARERVVWPFPSPAAAWITAFGAGRLDQRRGFVIGSIMLIRRSALDDVGEFDERFFLYAEETDWQRRAVNRGWTIGFVPDVKATHVGAGTGGSAKRRLQLFHTSLMIYMEKHYGRLGRSSFRLAMIVGGLARAALATGESKVAARRRVQLYLNPSRLEDRA